MIAAKRINDPWAPLERWGPPDVGSASKNEVAVALIEQSIGDQVRQTAVLGGSAGS
jgi:hypothetical protein